MALSDDSLINLKRQDVETQATLTMPVLTAAVLFYGSLCSHDTTSGAIKPFDGTQTDRLVGWHFADSVTGDTTEDDPPVGTILSGGFVWVDLPVATLADDATDWGKPVFATDDGTYTITDPTSGQVIGRIVATAGKAAGLADVRVVDVMNLLV